MITDNPPDRNRGGPIADAYIVVVVTPYGNPRRRAYLSLHAATAAVQRARDKGQPARMVLARLVPLPDDLEDDGRWSA